MKTINTLEDRLGVKFKNLQLLKTALTHSSYSNENGGECNERLEFLGDAVLELCMSKYLINHYNLSEGDMTKKRAQSVREEALVIYANHLELSEYLLLGHGEEQTGGRFRPAIIADAFEAVLGASFMEFGFDVTYEIFSKIIVNHIDEVLYIKDYKSTFQELVQADKRSLKYEIVSKKGPSHNTIFEAVVMMDDIIMGRGSGHTKKEAEQQAAKMALEKAVSK
ncbi:MAG: ribonuclease III [Anaeroplasmataceae bacterium]